MINVDVSPFLGFSDLMCHLEETGVGVSGCNVLLESKETKLGSR